MIGKNNRQTFPRRSFQTHLYFPTLFFSILSNFFQPFPSFPSSSTFMCVFFSLFTFHDLNFPLHLIFSPFFPLIFFPLPFFSVFFPFLSTSISFYSIPSLYSFLFSFSLSLSRSGCESGRRVTENLEKRIACLSVSLRGQIRSC